MLGSDIQNITDKRLRRLAILADNERSKIQYGWKSRLARKIGVHRSVISHWIAADKIPLGQKEEIVLRGYELKDWWDEPKVEGVAQKRQQSKPIRVDQEAAASRVLELLKDSAWTMRGLAACISKHTKKPIRRRLLGYHLRKSHIKPEWYQGICEYFGALAGYALWGEAGDDKDPQLAASEDWAFFQILFHFVAGLIKQGQDLQAKLKATQDRLAMLETLLGNCNPPEDIDERRVVWKHLEFKKRYLISVH